MELPSREKNFYFDVNGESGFRYEGHFAIKCRLNIAERHGMESDRSRLLGDSKNPTQDLQALALTLSTCRAHIAKGPEWFTQSRGLLEDEEVLYELYNKIVNTAEEWRKEVSDKANEKAKEAKESGN
jgi:hypothetical protein